MSSHEMLNIWWIKEFVINGSNVAKTKKLGK